MSKGHNNWADGAYFEKAYPLTKRDKALSLARAALGLVLLVPSTIGIYKHHQLGYKLAEKPQYESVSRGIETIHSLQLELRDLSYRLSKEDEIRESGRLQSQIDDICAKNYRTVKTDPQLVELVRMAEKEIPEKKMILWGLAFTGLFLASGLRIE